MNWDRVGWTVATVALVGGCILANVLHAGMPLCFSVGLATGACAYRAVQEWRS